jgi:hypothetical protein
MVLNNRQVSAHGFIAALIISFSASYASAASKQASYEPPRNSQGDPNIQGTWDFRTLTPLERPKSLGTKSVFTAEEQETFRKKAVEAGDVDKDREKVAASTDIEGAYNNFWFDYGTTMNEDRRTSLIIDPPNGRLPDLTPEASSQLKNAHLRNSPVRDILSIGLANFRPAGPEILGLSERCLLSFNAGPPLIPSAYNNNIRIVQTPSHVVLFTEMIHDARIVQMADNPPLPAELEKWTGASRGYWDGNTLVVVTTNFTDKTPAFQMPIDLNDTSRNGVVGSGKNMELTERFTLVSKSRLIYEYTIDAPDTFTKPFTVAIPMKATEDQIYEYACHEGNYGLIGMLKGARQIEKEEANASL